MIFADLFATILGPFGLVITAIAAARAIRFARADHADSAQATKQGIEILVLAIAGLGMLGFTAVIIAKAVR